MISPAGALWRFLAGYGFAVVLLGFLFLLTFLGTIAQVGKSLYEVQEQYFAALIVRQEIGPVTLPLPGVALLLALLAVNLVAGGLIRIRKSRATAGIIIAHLGIIWMLVAGLVEYTASTKGHLTLFEGQQSAEYVSYHEWEIALSRDGGTTEYVVPGDRFMDLAPGRSVTFSHPEVPASFALDTVHPNCEVHRVPRPDAEPGLMDTYQLVPAARSKEAERDLAGCFVTLLRLPDAPGERRILWGGAHLPLTFTADDGTLWRMELRKRRWPLPFTIHLVDFRKEDHPGTTLARAFESDVTVLERGADEPVTISMNQPLRRRGYTLFQSSFGQVEGGRPYSTFAVVQNPADAWPEQACWIIAIGLLLHFGHKLFLHVRAASLAPARAAALALLACALAPAAAAEPMPPIAARQRAWPKDVVQILSELPVQDLGRVKPLSTYARFVLLKMNAATSFARADGGGPRLSAMEWLLDVLFFPQMARHYRCFAVDDVQVLHSVGVRMEGRGKRDRYSFHELEPAQAALAERARAYALVESTERTPVQQQTLRLSSGLTDFANLARLLDFAREPYALEGDRDLERLFGGPGPAPFESVLQHLAEVVALARTARLGHPDAPSAANALILDLQRGLFGSQALRLLPPVGGLHGTTGHGDVMAAPSAVETWLSPLEACLAQAAQRLQSGAGEGPLVAAEHQRILALLSTLARRAHGSGDRAGVDSVEFRTTAAALRDELRALAEARGEYRRIGLEVSFYRGKFLWFNPWFFLAAFLLACLAAGVRRGQRRLFQVSLGLVAVSLALLIAGITLRCVIRGRPPVSTLYETILFITAVGVLVGLVLEWIHRRRVPLAVAAAVGTIGMFLANRYELHEATDTMPQLVAVLDTNFWLATHVTCITVGYSAGLLAAAVAHVYLVARMASRRAETLRTLARMTYGLLCFALLFSIVGTILGGVWANDSWGRFWGWDPKENGALLIVISQLMILHARMGGYLRDQGIAVAAVLSGFVVVFSWWGVNLLGVGLHSYGFTSGAALALQWFYSLETAFLLVVAAWWRLTRSRPARA